MRFFVQSGTVTGVARGGLGDGLVGEEVGACAFRRLMLGCGYEEFAGRVEVVGIPVCAEHALAKDQVDVFAFADAEAYPWSIWERTFPVIKPRFLSVAAMSPGYAGLLPGPDWVRASGGPLLPAS